jgi:hypothetical protein
MTTRLGRLLLAKDAAIECSSNKLFVAMFTLSTMAEAHHQHYNNTSQKRKRKIAAENSVLIE